MAHLPDNVVRTSEQPWETPPAPVAGFGGRVVELPPLFPTGLGAHLEELPPGLCSCPLHWHLAEEEHFYVLEGTLTAREWIDGAVREFEVPAGAFVAWPAGTRVAHQFVNRGDRTARFIALSDQRRSGDVCYYPTTGKVLLRGPRRLGVLAVDPEAALERALAAAPPVERVPAPPHVVRGDAVPERELDGVFGRPLARVAGARAVFAHLDRFPPGARTRLHAHSANDEWLWVLAGELVLEQWRGAARERGGPDFAGATRETCTLRAGDVAVWPAGAPLAHRVTNAGASDALALVVGLDRPDDAVTFPETGEVALPALGLRGRWLDLAYWAHERAP